MICTTATLNDDLETSLLHYSFAEGCLEDLIESREHSFCSQSDFFELITSFNGLPPYNDKAPLSSIGNEELEKVLRTAFENCAKTLQNKSYIEGSIDDIFEETEKEAAATSSLPNNFIKSILEIIDKRMTPALLNKAIIVKLHENISNGIAHTHLEKLMFLSIALLKRIMKENKRHIGALGPNEEGFGLEGRINDVDGDLVKTEDQLLQVKLKLADVEQEMQQLQEENKKLTDEHDLTRKDLASEKKRYMDLLQDHELQTAQYIKELSQYCNELENKKEECSYLRTELEKIKIQECKLNKTSKFLQSTIIDLRRKAENTLKYPKENKWYGQQIIALEADRDMYYHQVCTLQEELNIARSSFIDTIKEKDSIIQDIQSKLEQVQPIIEQYTQFAQERELNEDALTKLERLRKELNQIEHENSYILGSIDQRLEILKSCIPASKKKQLDNSILFLNTSFNEEDEALRPLTLL